MARNWKRVSVPISDDLRQIAKIERRSISRQAEVAIQQFVRAWRAALPLQPADQATRPMSDKRD
jgi:hypothetical protein